MTYYSWRRQGSWALDCSCREQPSPATEYAKASLQLVSGIYWTLNEVLTHLQRLSASPASLRNWDTNFLAPEIFDLRSFPLCHSSNTAGGCKSVPAFWEKSLSQHHYTHGRILHTGSCHWEFWVGMSQALPQCMSSILVSIRLFIFTTNTNSTLLNSFTNVFWDNFLLTFNMTNSQYTSARAL